MSKIFLKTLFVILFFITSVFSQTINEIKVHNEAEHMKNRTDLKFIKDNMFNPHDGLWAETKQNTQYRQEAKKWRYGVGIGLISLVVKNIWDTMVG